MEFEIPIDWYGRLLGKEIKYINEKNKVESGILKEFKIKNEVQLAVIERSGLIFNKTVKIPVSCICRSNFYSEEEQPQEIQEEVEDSPFSFWFRGIEFVKVEHDKFKSGDQVVWNVIIKKTGHSPAVSPLIGRVQEVGRSAEVTANFAVIVQFDEPTNRLPGYLSHPPENRNVVLMGELLSLQEYLEFWHPAQNSPTGNEGFYSDETLPPSAPPFESNVNSFSF